MVGVERVGVIGAGVIGVGVAQNLAQTGYHVVLVDTSEDILQSARAQIANNLRLQRLLSKSGALDDPNHVLDSITSTTQYTRLENVDFVIENVTEKWEIKRDVHARLDAICPPHCVIAINTSAISITRLASVTKRPSQVLGIHFMNPVPMKPVVEVIRGYHTSDHALEIARGMLTAMGKECIVVEDMPGFVSNRVLMLTINEAIYVVQDRVAGPEEVDTIFKRCFGHKMGPLETADLIGLDTILYSIEALYESFNDGKYRPCPLLKKMVDAGLHGRKSGRGFYAYT
jgi:3-hydroxybutyryl-CoA dehydrogenase